MTGVLLLALRIIGVPVVIAGTAWICAEIGKIGQDRPLRRHKAAPPG